MALPLTNDPRDLLLGSDNDLVVGTDLSFSRGIQAVIQSCRIKIQMFAGEWFLNLDSGIPYWQEILGGKPDAAIASARVSLRKALLSVDGVLEVTRLDVLYNRQTRKLTIAWQVSTGLGETPVDVLDLGA